MAKKRIELFEALQISPILMHGLSSSVHVKHRNYLRTQCQGLLFSDIAGRQAAILFSWFSPYGQHYRHVSIADKSNVLFDLEPLKSFLTSAAAFNKEPLTWLFSWRVCSAFINDTSVASSIKINILHEQPLEMFYSFHKMIWSDQMWRFV